MEALTAGQDVALVSDAGTPGISDPGEQLVKHAIAKGIQVVSLPGPSAVICALAASGLATSSFAFFGFPPARGAARREFMAKIMAEDNTVVFYEAPHRLVKTLSELAQPDPVREAVVARELTKVHEQYIRGNLSDLLTHFTAEKPRGECTVLLAPVKVKDLTGLMPEELVLDLISKGMNKKEAVREAARQLGVPKREVYHKVCVKKQ